jgi:lysophospholipase L1-like esterase
VSRRILILGDSITQGHEGDYTWRYRLWEWLRASDPSANVTFVGPFPGTYPPHDAVAPPGPRPTLPGHDIRVWGGYALDADPSFLRDSARSHFAHWGMLAAQVAPFVEDLVAEFRPDLVLSALGFNDLAYMLTVEQALRVVREIVERVQRAKPDVGFAVANVPQRLELSGREELAEKTDRYNGLLEGLLEELGTRESPVWLVRLREEYQCESFWTRLLSREYAG